MERSARRPNSIDQRPGTGKRVAEPGAGGNPFPKQGMGGNGVRVSYRRTLGPRPYKVGTLQDEALRVAEMKCR